jgi:hypothetical protein
MRHLLAGLTIWLVAGIAATPGVSTLRQVEAEPSFLVRSDVSIGSFAVKANGTLGGATRAYGEPDSLRKRYGATCTATWRLYQLTIAFYNLGGGDPCTPRGGKFSRAIMRGQRWRTSKGLRVGMPSARIQRFYPKAMWHRGFRGYWPTGWWLVTRPSIYGPDATHYPGLLAETRSGRILSLQVRYPAGGD